MRRCCKSSFPALQHLEWFKVLTTDNLHRLANFGPLWAVICLFVHVLKAPKALSAASDLVLLDVAAGYFSRLEFATQSHMAYPFIKDLPRFARKVVERPDRNRRQQLEGANNGALEDFTPPSMFQQQLASANDPPFGEVSQRTMISTTVEC